MTDCLTLPHRVKAGKRHVCDWCGKTIEIGEYHTASTNVGDYIYTWRECDRCEKYVSEMMHFPGDFYFDTIADGYSRESFEEFMCDYHKDVLEDWRAK